MNKLILKCAKGLVLGMLFIFAVSTGFSGASYAQYTTRPGDLTLEDDDQWSEDLGKKMDTAIKLLSVIKEELDETEKEKRSSGVSKKTDQKQPDLGEEVKEKTSLALRIWRRVRKILFKEDAQVKGEPDWTEDLEDNVDKLVRVSEKVYKIMADYTAQVADPSKPVDQADWDKALTQKIDKTIKVLDAVKGELDEKQQD